jgi:two-component system sensor histidine kinase KdpD
VTVHPGSTGPTGRSGTNDPARTIAAPAGADWGREALIASAILGSLALGTAVVAALEGPAIAIDDASTVFLIAVVLMGAAFGTWPAILTAIGAFIVYDLLFTEPRFSLTVDDPREWLDLLLFLFVALAVGRLVASQRRRAEEADRRTREANSLFALSRMLATGESTEAAAPDIARRLAADGHLRRVWIAVGPVGRERPVADTGTGPQPVAAIAASLVRTPGEEPAKWVRTHRVERAGHADRTDAGAGEEQFRVHIESDGHRLGILAAIRDRGLGDPSREETRILALAADQIALSLRRDQLRRTATDLEVAQRGEALKSALVDAVSHDLRTPLASIRATAGSLADPAVPWTDEGRRTAVAVIDAEAARLDRLVRGILDLGRIDSGTLRPELEPHDLDALVRPVVERARPSLGDRPVTVAVADGLPPVLVDDVLFDAVLTNLLENVAAHAPEPAPVRISATAVTPDRVRIVVEDGGPGVPDAELGRLFDRFYRVPGASQGARRGLGIGLSVVRGLLESMGGAASAERSSLGGLAIALDLATARPEPEPGS